MADNAAQSQDPNAQGQSQDQPARTNITNTELVSEHDKGSMDKHRREGQQRGFSPSGEPQQQSQQQS